MGEAESIVFIIDDDPLYRRASERLVRSAGFRVQGFASAGDFLSSRRPNVPSCLILDVRLPGSSGLDLQRELAEAGVHLPIIFVTGHGDIPMSVQAMKAGAVDEIPVIFITAYEDEGVRAQALTGGAGAILIKPFSEEALMNAIHVALTA
jgi:FixJ family two-component response regulator